MLKKNGREGRDPRKLFRSFEENDAFLARTGVIYIRPRTNSHANKGRPRESADAPLSHDSEHGRSHISTYQRGGGTYVYVSTNTDGKLDRYTRPPRSPQSLTERQFLSSVFHNADTLAVSKFPAEALSRPCRVHVPVPIYRAAR